MGSLSCIRDLSKSQQQALFDEVRRMKLAYAEKSSMDPFKLNISSGCCYLVFMENSTRTKESFRNAALFHDNIKVNIFDCQTSSFTKGETVTDTLKMLMGYSLGRSIFVIRSKIEGITRWLEDALWSYADRHNLERPCLINAGDGKHEHPTQELLDNFTFWEHLQYDFSHIHIALIGDLTHGRTVHSKADGLLAFDEVKVDIVAPDELDMPLDYRARMHENGFTMRSFSSIDQYLRNPCGVATVWYFTRLQLERMDAEVMAKADELSASVTFKPEWASRLPAGVKFFHPLPRNADNPVIPFALDDSKLNGWDQQSRNGYFTRIILLKQLAQSPATTQTKDTRRVQNFCCANDACVSHPSQKQREVVQRGYYPARGWPKCYYCDRVC